MSNIYVVTGDWYTVDEGENRFSDYDAWASCAFTDEDRAYERCDILNDLALVKDIKGLMDLDRNLPSKHYLDDGVEYYVEECDLIE